MKVFISADIEGVTGVTHWDETHLQKESAAPHRDQMTAEVAAACEGALNAGASEVWVKDAHGEGRNVAGDRLPQQVKLVRGWSGHPFGMVEELDRSFQAMLMVGYHSPAGGGGNPLAHTMSLDFVHIKLNGQYASEFLLHAFVAAYVGVPVVFVSGDRALCELASELNPHIASVAVKEGIGASTVNIHPALATARISEAVERALQGDLSRALITLPDHFRMEICYRTHSSAYAGSFYPGAERIDAHTVAFEHDDYFEVLRCLTFAA
ncbi:MAG: amino acid amidase [Chloroflexi bacterium]|nr:amino acid amidase [Chloroflexota bacterium]